MNLVKKIKPVFEDARGQIFDIINGKNIKHIGIIVSHSGTSRGNHYHKHSTQYTYILNGKVEVKSKDITKKKQKVSKTIASKGDLITHPPMIAHSLNTIEESIMLVFTTKPRNKGGYERDNYKVDF